jgi:hypothetical protein
MRCFTLVELIETKNGIMRVISLFALWFESHPPVAETLFNGSGEGYCLCFLKNHVVIEKIAVTILS